eukprot:66872-Alexandrium_andersonii.AAC.1
MVKKTEGGVSRRRAGREGSGAIMARASSQRNGRDKLYVGLPDGRVGASCASPLRRAGAVREGSVHQWRPWPRPTGTGIVRA